MIPRIMATILKWKSLHGYSFTDIGKMVGLTRTKVCRHAHGITPVDAAEAELYISKSKGAITLTDLCKPAKRRKQAPA